MFLGIDLGTSALKVVAVDDSGRVVGINSALLESSRPRPGWSEQQPDHWWAALVRAVRGLDSTTLRRVTAVGLSGQMHGATLLDGRDRVLRPCILWNDGRSAAQCLRLEAEFPGLAHITGNRAMPGFTAPKLLWVAENEPELFGAVARVLLPKDYLRLRLTGAHATDASDASGTLWLDVGARRWSERALAACRLSLRQMPEVFEGTQVTGTLLPEAAAELGLPRVVVAAGGGDNAAGAVGAGVHRTGEALVSLGTSGVIFLADEQYRPNPAGGVHTFCHALPGRWHEMSVMLSAASAVDAMAALLGFTDAAALHEAAEAHGVASGATEVFLPYLNGERTPHNDADAKGVFFGLTAASTRASLAQAVLEGVAFGLADGLAALDETGCVARELNVIGGGARSRYWGRILAATLNRPLVYREGAEVGPAFGAARLARLATSGESVEVVCIPPPIRAVVEPDPDLRSAFARRHSRYRALYPALAGHFKETHPC